MTATPSPSRSFTLGLAGIGVIVGAGLTYLVLRPPASAPAPAAPSAAAPESRAEPSEVSVTITPDGMARAAIRLATVESAKVGDVITIPALIEPNAYNQTVVTALLAGRVTRVVAELGQQVRRGQPLAELYSPELAEAQRAYISMSADLQAHERQLARTEQLVTIGSASRQELEQGRAEHTVLMTSVEGARTRLLLLGLTDDQVAQLVSASQIAATTEVRSPLDGVVTAREANVGLNVDGATPLFTVTDLSTVWVVGDLYELDFPRVRTGSPATIAVSAYPDLALPATVSYIDPQLNRETRTAKVRAEAQNSGGRLRLGMYAQMRVASNASDSWPVIPKTALQTIGDQTVVYLSDPRTPGRFVERPIRTGAETTDTIVVVSGVKAGETVVAAGSFFVRAERERLGPSGAGSPPQPTGGQSADQRQTARVIVSEQGFAPDRLLLKAGVPAQVTFVRTTEVTCAKEVVFPSLNIRRELPLNTPVSIQFTPSSGETRFVCGMNMFRGTITAQ